MAPLTACPAPPVGRLWGLTWWSSRRLRRGQASARPRSSLLTHSAPCLGHYRCDHRALDADGLLSVWSPVVADLTGGSSAGGHGPGAPSPAGSPQTMHRSASMVGGHVLTGHDRTTHRTHGTPRVHALGYASRSALRRRWSGPSWRWWRDREGCMEAWKSKKNHQYSPAIRSELTEVPI